MTDNDIVTRLSGRLMDIERRRSMAVLTFAVPVGPDIDALAAEIGNSCMLGVLMVRDIPAADEDTLT
jgi:hypothetical protein